MSVVQARRWTRQEYDRMIEAGVLTPDDRVELIDGEILAMTPQGSPHATAVLLVQDALRAAFGRDVGIYKFRPVLGSWTQGLLNPQIGAWPVIAWTAG